MALGGAAMGANSMPRLMAMIQAQQGKMASQSISMGRKQFENMYMNVMRTAQGGNLSDDQESALLRQAQSMSGTAASIGEASASVFGAAARPFLQTSGLEHLGVLGMPYLGRDVARATSGIPGIDASQMASQMASHMYGANGRYNMASGGGLGGVSMGSATVAASMAGNAGLSAGANLSFGRTGGMLQSMMGGGDPGSLLASFNVASGGAVSQLPASNLESMVKFMRTASLSTAMGPGSAYMDNQSLMNFGSQLAQEAMRNGIPGPAGFMAASNIAANTSGAMTARAGGVDRREEVKTTYDADTGERTSETKTKP